MGVGHGQLPDCELVNVSVRGANFLLFTGHFVALVKWYMIMGLVKLGCGPDTGPVGLIEGLFTVMGLFLYA